MVVFVKSTEHYVGDDKGWRAGFSNWPNSKLFLAGDALVFKNNRKPYDVAKVNKYGYISREATASVLASMARLGRVTAAKATAWAALALVFFLQWGELVESTQHIVGGNKGWTYGISDWPNGKVFHDGEVLVFNYVMGEHNVAKVNEEGYSSCAITNYEDVYTTGNDCIKLNRGTNYFICGYPDNK
ncbi:hypothetical protein HPP92_009439 [Vanilla planifolia]|uniref:Phytocyanin domain-containing protein n=1 Tax=Vanilla planifolia TaxID=51239 RepID=A0A835R4J0_VANPL|nr:hypothetical protein HPP92_009439 [Vanilla planifolia]